MRTFRISGERTTRSHDGRKLSFHAVIQGENRDLLLENPHRLKKALRVATSPLEAQWVYIR